MILKNLHIVGKDSDSMDIHIKGDTIARIRNSADKDIFNDDVKLNFENCLAFPGLINSHDHLEYNLYPRLGHKIYRDYVEWGNDIHIKDKELINSIESVPAELRLQYGVIKNLISGVTSVAHHGSYNPVLNNSPVTIIRKGTCIHSVRLGGRWKYKINLPKSGEPYTIHTGEGTNTESAGEIDELIRWNLFKRKLIGIHGIAMTEEQSKNFTAIIWCPDSNIFLFGKTADIRTLKKNTAILFGTDSTLTADGNIFENLRTAKNLNLLSDTELFDSLTKTAAEVWGLNNCGSIEEGKISDIVIARQKSVNLYESFYNTNPEDILLILKNGEVVLFDSTIKESLRGVMKHTNSFNEINIKGHIKYADYPVGEIINKIKEQKSGTEIKLNDNFV